jgi:hypothetical protein
MSVIRPRNRLVYFRVSEDEFKQFTQLCKAAGARSISDLVRLGLDRIVQDRKGNRDDEMRQKLAALDDSLAQLHSKVEELNSLVARLVKRDIEYSKSTSAGADLA